GIPTAARGSRRSARSAMWCCCATPSRPASRSTEGVVGAPAGDGEGTGKGGKGRPRDAAVSATARAGCGRGRDGRGCGERAGSRHRDGAFVTGTGGTPRIFGG